jgi:hypothetical protein
MKTYFRLCLLLIAFAVVLSFTAVSALSQDKPADTMQLVIEKIRADKKLLVAENLQLTESEASSFWPLYDNYQRDLAKLLERVTHLIDDYAANYRTMSDVTARKLIDDYVSFQSDRTKILGYYLPMFRKVLPEKKVALYYQLENKIYSAVSYGLAEKIPLIR